MHLFFFHLPVMNSIGNFNASLANVTGTVYPPVEKGLMQTMISWFISDKNFDVAFFVRLHVFIYLLITLF